MKNVIEVKCPICSTKFNYYSSEYRPFCREKCKMIDLGNWFNEKYTVEGEPSQQALDEILDNYEEE